MTNDPRPIAARDNWPRDMVSRPFVNRSAFDRHQGAGGTPPL
jgi:hypothetical protein